MKANLLGPLLFLSAAIGFVAHRASLCTVRAVAEMFNAGTAHMLAGFVKAALWAALVYGLLLTVLTPQTASFPAFEPRWLAIAGGFLFGVGAAINRGCSYSTLQRIADGDLAGLLSILGIALGVLLWSMIDSSLAMARPVQSPSLWVELDTSAPWLLAALALLGAFELALLWRSRARDRRGLTALTAPQYRVGTAAVVMGVCAGLLYALQGAWSYTGTLRRALDAAYRALPGPATLQWLLFAAVFTGMLASSLQRGSFALRWRVGTSLVPRLGGGTLMGFGAALVPGGNDTLLLTGIPSLSGWAIAAYGALVCGVALTLWLRRMRGKPIPNVTCSGGLCVEQPG